MFQNPLKPPHQPMVPLFLPIFLSIQSIRSQYLPLVTHLSYTYNQTPRRKAAGDTIRADDIVMKYEPGVFLIGP